MLLNWLRRLRSVTRTIQHPPWCPHRPRSASLGLEALEARAVPATTLVWTGLGTNNLWSNAANWMPAGTDTVPKSGDTLAFPVGAQQLGNHNDIQGLVLSQIIFTGPGYDISGNGVSLTAGITTPVGGGSQASDTIEFRITTTQPQGFNVDTGFTLLLGGGIKVASKLTLDGAGTVQLGGASTVSGELDVNHGALNATFGGSLTVEHNAILTDAASVTAVSGGTLDDHGTVAVSAGGTLSLQSGLTVESDGALTDAGTVTVATKNGLDDRGTATVRPGGVLGVQAGSVTVKPGATLDDFGTIALAQPSTGNPGGGVLDVAGTLTVESAAVVDDAGTLTVEHSGTLTVSGTVNVGFKTPTTPTNTGTLDDHGTTNVAGGIIADATTLTVESDGKLTDAGIVDVLKSGTLDDRGDVKIAPTGTLTDRHTVTIEPGVTLDDGGFLNVDQAGTLTSKGNLVVEANRTLDVSGTVVLGGTSQQPAILAASLVTTANPVISLHAGAALDLDATGAGTIALNLPGVPGFAPAPGQQFTLVANATGNPVQGLFDDPSGVPLQEQGIIHVGALAYEITYHGGTGGHDVVLVNITSAAVATHFAVSAPASATAGSAFSVTVTALDAFNNTAAGYTGTVHFTSTDGQAVLSADATLTNGVGTFSVTLKMAGNQTVTVTDTVSSGTTGTSGAIAVSAAVATHYAVSAPASATAGTAFNLTVTAQDQFGNTATGYTGTAHFSSTDVQAVLPANATLTNGVGAFSATLKTAGNQTVTATDTTTSSITGTSNAIAVSAAAATHFSLGAPSSATAGTVFSFTVIAQDQFNNTATGYTGTVHFSSTDGQATVPANSALTNGTGTFSATLTTAGSQTLTATDTTTGSIVGTSAPIAVATAVATHYAVSAPPSATAGTAFNFTVTALDQFNNTATGYTGTVHFTSTDGQAVLPANATLTNGAGTFSATLTTAGSQTITATDTANSSITGASNSIAVSAAAATHLAVSAPATATAGSAFNFTVTALDAFNNTAVGYAGTVHFTTSDGQAVLPANSALTNGTGTFSTTLRTAGGQTISATDTANSGTTGTSGAIAVSAAVATHYAVSAPPSATAGTAFNFTVTALDQFNNTATGYTGTVHFTSTDGQAVLPANATLTNGAGTFSATLTTAGSQTITATDTATGSITGSATVVNVPTQFNIVIVSHLSVPVTVDGQAVPAGGSVMLLSGTHTLADPNAVAGGTVQFTVTPGGILDLTLSPVGILSGQGTSTLTVNGRRMALDTHAVPFPLQLDHTLTVTTSPNAAFAFTALPGTYSLAGPGGSGIPVAFTLNPDGSVSFDPSLGAMFSLAGTSTLVVRPVVVNIIPTQLAGVTTTFTVNGVPYSTSQPQTVSLWPGPFVIQYTFGNVTRTLTFAVSPQDVVSFDPSEGPFVSQQGPNTLLLLPP